MNNKNKGYEYEILYVFAPVVSLVNVEGIEELVGVYVKFNIIEKSNNSRLLVMSFHRLNRSIEYAFEKIK